MAAAASSPKCTGRGCDAHGRSPVLCRWMHDVFERSESGEGVHDTNPASAKDAVVNTADEARVHGTMARFMTGTFDDDVAMIPRLSGQYGQKFVLGLHDEAAADLSLSSAPCDDASSQCCSSDAGAVTPDSSSLAADRAAYRDEVARALKAVKSARQAQAQPRRVRFAE